MMKTFYCKKIWMLGALMLVNVVLVRATIETRIIVNSANFSPDGVYNLKDSIFTCPKLTTDGGGAMKVEADGVFIGTNVTFEMNITHGTAMNNGGAIYNAGRVTLIDCSMKRNSSRRDEFFDNAYGGAVYNTGLLTVKGGCFRNNYADTFGGGIQENGTKLDIDGTIFGNNLSIFSGGAIGANKANVNITVNNSEFSCNAADMSGQGGGAIYVLGADSGNAVLTVKKCIFKNNASSNRISGSGGAIYSSKCWMVVDSCTFSGNQANFGGAIYNTDLAELSDVTFCDNYATKGGGAVYNSGVINITGRIDLQTKRDTWLNTGYYTKTGEMVEESYATVNWDISAEAKPDSMVSIRNYERYLNVTAEVEGVVTPMCRQTITVAENQPFGEYILAIGDLSDIPTDSTGKYCFKVKTAIDSIGKNLLMGREVEYRGVTYKLYADSMNLILKVGHEPIEVIVGEAGLATFYAKWPVVVPDGVEVYGMEYVPDQNMLSCTNSEAYVAGTVLPASVGFIIEAEKGTYAFAASKDSKALAITSCLTGVATDSQVADIGTTYTIYTLAEGIKGLGFYRFIGTTLAANKAFFLLPDTLAAKEFISFGGQTSAVNSVTVINEVENTTIYNLAGQRIIKMQKGINIVNGKKILK